MEKITHDYLVSYQFPGGVGSGIQAYKLPITAQDMDAVRKLASESCGYAPERIVIMSISPLAPARVTSS